MTSVSETSHETERVPLFSILLLTAMTFLASVSIGLYANSFLLAVSVAALLSILFMLAGLITKDIVRAIHDQKK